MPVCLDGSSIVEKLGKQKKAFCLRKPFVGWELLFIVQ